MAESGFYLQWLVVEPISDISEYFGIYGVGQWEHHMMDWRGCNFWTKRMSKEKFSAIEEAEEFVAKKVESGEWTRNMRVDGGYHESKRENTAGGKTLFFLDIWGRLLNYHWAVVTGRDNWNFYNTREKAARAFESFRKKGEDPVFKVWKKESYEDRRYVQRSA